MSNTGKVVLWIVIAVIVIGGIWWWLASNGNAPAMTDVTNPSGNTGAQNTPTTTASYPQGDSDQSINQDMTSINAQMNGLSSDNASVTQSMNDQSVPQGQ